MLAQYGDDIYRGYNLKPWKKGVLSAIKISDRSINYLENIGLPLEFSMTLDFNVPRNEIIRYENRENLLVLGHDSVISICLDEQKAGCVIGALPGDADLYFNINVECLGIFLSLYNLYRTQPSHIKEDERILVVNKIGFEMKCVDPTAFDDPNFWWPLVLEQMTQGFL